MKAYLRVHPKVTNWPPSAGGAYGPGDVFPDPLDGKLHAVKIVDAFGDHREVLEVVREVRGRLWAGEVYAADTDDPHHVLQKLCAELQKLIGLKIEDISNLQFDL